MGNLREQCTREQVEAIRNMIWVGRSGEYLTGWKWFARHSSENEVIIPQEKGGEFCEGAKDCHVFADLFYSGVAALYQEVPEKEGCEEPKPEEPKHKELKPEEPPKKERKPMKRWKWSTTKTADNEAARFLNESGMTQKQLAEMLHISLSAVNSYATGRIEPPLDRIVEIRRIREEWLKEQ